MAITKIEVKGHDVYFTYKARGEGANIIDRIVGERFFVGSQNVESLFFKTDIPTAEALIKEFFNAGVLSEQDVQKAKNNIATTLKNLRDDHGQMIGGSGLPDK